MDDFLEINLEKKLEKRVNSAWVAFGPRPRGRGLAQRPMLAQGARLCGPAAHCALQAVTLWPSRRLKPARPAQSPNAPSALLTQPPRTERPGRCGRRRLAAGLGAAAPAARASARYGGLAGQHESGWGSPGRWRDGGVAERYRRDGDLQRREVGRRPTMLRGTPVAP
jgi:hypothetical protein